MATSLLPLFELLNQPRQAVNNNYFSERITSLSQHKTYKFVSIFTCKMQVHSNSALIQSPSAIQAISHFQQRSAVIKHKCWSKLVGKAPTHCTTGCHQPGGGSVLTRGTQAQ